MKASRFLKVRIGVREPAARSILPMLALVAASTVITLPVAAFPVSIPSFRTVQNTFNVATVHDTAPAAPTVTSSQLLSVPVHEVVDAGLVDPCAERGQSRSHKFDVGNSWAGVSGGYEAGALRRDVDCVGDPKKRRGARLFLKSDITGELLKHDIKAYDIEASIKLEGDTETVSKLRVQFGPHVLINETKETIQWTESKTITLLKAEQWVVIGVVPVKLEAKLAAVLEGELKLESNIAGQTSQVRSPQLMFVAQWASNVEPPPLIGFKGKVEASLKGIGSAGIDVVVAGAGVAGEFNILQVTVTPDLGFLDDLMGQFKVCFQPVQVKLKAFLTYWFFGERKQSKTLASWDSPEYCKTLVDF